MKDAHVSPGTSLQTPKKDDGKRVSLGDIFSEEARINKSYFHFKDLHAFHLFAMGGESIDDKMLSPISAMVSGKKSTNGRHILPQADKHHGLCKSPFK